MINVSLFAATGMKMVQKKGANFNLKEKKKNMSKLKTQEIMLVRCVCEWVSIDLNRLYDQLINFQYQF